MAVINQYRFFEWDYDNDVCIIWEREGECNGCGACCLGVISLRVTGLVDLIAKHDPRNGGPTTDGKGVWYSVEVGDRYRYFQMTGIEKTDHRCSMLTEDNKCRIHAGKHLLSRAWPINPKQVEAFEDCSYTFQEIARWSISKELS